MRFYLGAVSLVAVTFALAGCASEPETTVPKVVPSYVQDAIAKLDDAGLQAVIEKVPPITNADLSVNGYSVIGQEPRPGTRVPRGSSVRLTVEESLNGGPGGLGKRGIVSVPDLAGLGVNRAISLAGEGGLRATVIQPDGELEALIVRSQDLAAGTRVQAGTEIRLSLD